jgi:hypothetical protein
VLTGFMFREMTWNPRLAPAEARRIVRQRFFGEDAPESLLQDLLTLRELMREHRQTNVDSLEKRRQTLDSIQRQIDQVRPNAWPKTLDTLDLMQRAIDDARAHMSPVEP